MTEDSDTEPEEIVQEEKPSPYDENGVWHCPNCGSTDPHHEMELEDVTVDVTCETVYLLFEDGTGMGFDHDKFDQIVDHYQNR